MSLAGSARNVRWPHNAQPLRGGWGREDLLWNVKVGATWQAGSADLVGPVVFEHDVDPTEQLTRDCTHRRAPRLALIESTLQIGSQIWIRLTGRDLRQPQGSAQER